MRRGNSEHPQGCRRAIAIMGRGAAFVSALEEIHELLLLRSQQYLIRARH
jgi:hypothetical protein